MKKQETCSLAHLTYLKKERQKTFAVHFFRILFLLLIVAFWELSADTNLVNPFITSSPSRIFKTFLSLLKDGSLSYHVLTTLSETLVGFFIAVIVGYLLALVLWWSRLLNKIFEPYLVVLNALPKIALGPLIIIWFGTGKEAIVCITVLIGLVLTVLNMLDGFNATDENKILLLRSMHATKRQILLKLVIPSSLPTFFSVLKIDVGMAWIGSIMGEYIVSKAGIGYLIVYGGQVFKLDLVMCAVLILCLLAAGMYALIALLEKTFVKHKP